MKNKIRCNNSRICKVIGCQHKVAHDFMHGFCDDDCIADQGYKSSVCRPLKSVKSRKPAHNSASLPCCANCVVDPLSECRGFKKSAGQELVEGQKPPTNKAGAPFISCVWCVNLDRESLNCKVDKCVNGKLNA